MSIRRILTLLLAFSLPASLALTSCGDDDTTPVDPNAGIQQVNIRMHAGDQFTYDRWDLDANNQKVGSSRRYDIEFNKGIGLVGQYSDWFFRIGRDHASNKRDTLFIRTETVTRQSNGSSYTQEVMAYGFMYKVLQSFIAQVMTLGNIGVPTIAAEQWNSIAMYYDKNGNALPVGTEWAIGPEDGVIMNFTISGTPIPVTAKLKGKYESREEKIQVGNKQITTWKSSVSATFTALGSTILQTKIHFWFSDDPAGQIRVFQESSKATVMGVGSIDIPGETQELVSWF